MPKINVTVKWSGKKFDDIELGKIQSISFAQEENE